MKTICSAIFFLSAVSILHGSVEIPLYLNQVETLKNSNKFAVGLYVGIGGGPQRLYQLDTGNDFFLPAYSDNLNQGVSQWWGSDVDSNNSVQSKASFGGRTVEFQTANASIQFYSNASSASPLVSSQKKITVAQGTSAHVENHPTDTLPWQSQAEAGEATLLGVPGTNQSEFTYYGNFGAGLFANDDSDGLYPVLGQFVSSTGDALRGYVISFDTQSMTLYFDSDFENGANPVADFDLVAGLVSNDGVNFPNTNYGTTVEEGLVVTKAGVEGTTSAQFNALLDTGGLDLEMPFSSDFTSISKEISSGDSGTDYLLDSDLEFLISFLAPNGENNPTLTFTTGDKNQDDAVILLDSSSEPSGYNLGWNLFQNYDVYFDAANTQIRFNQIPEPSQTIPLLSLVVITVAYLFKRRRSQ